MSWHETNPVNERLKFVASQQTGRFTMTELCTRFGVSRKTGYKILARYDSDGVEGLRNQSRAPIAHPNQTSAEVEGQILRVRKAHPTWGSKKILAVLLRTDPGGQFPARSTIDAILKRAGVVVPRGVRRRRQPSSPPVVEATGPNEVWSIDYKGWFRVGDGTRCDPLTVNDSFSRVSLVIQAMVSPKLIDVKKRLEKAFRDYGVPKYLLSDNGPPFASTGLGKLSRLGVWLLKVGVMPVLIEPGRPDQNGRHERFHETLKAETAKPPRPTIRAQAAAFESFQITYNEERPHEALDMKVPAELYDFSPRSLPDTLEDHAYDSGLEVRRVRRDGSIKWAGEFVFVGEALAGELVGLEPLEEGLSQMFLGPKRLGVLHERSKTVVPIGARN